jgi:hypothetical protein
MATLYLLLLLLVVLLVLLLLLWVWMGVERELGGGQLAWRACRSLPALLSRL